jgi:hypothetical protein
MVGALQLAAIGAFSVSLTRQGMVGPAHIAARRRSLSFRNGHGINSSKRDLWKKRTQLRAGQVRPERAKHHTDLARAFNGKECQSASLRSKIGRF